MSFFPTAPRYPRSTNERPFWFLASDGFLLHPAPLRFEFRYVRNFGLGGWPDPPFDTFAAELALVDFPISTSRTVFEFSGQHETITIRLFIEQRPVPSSQRDSDTEPNPLRTRLSWATPDYDYDAFRHFPIEPRPDATEFPRLREWGAPWFTRDFGPVGGKALLWVRQSPRDDRDPAVIEADGFLAAMDDDRDSDQRF